MFKYLFGGIKNEKGQAIVETALVLPLLLLLLCGIIEIGWVSYNKLTLSYCSREGARYGIVHAADADVVQQVIDRVFEVTPESMREEIEVTVNFSNVNSPRLGSITVEVDAMVKGLTPIIGSIFSGGEGVSLSAQCVMKVE